MQITKLDQLDARPAFVQLRNPVTDEPFTGPDDRPLGLSVIGFESAGMRQASLTNQRSMSAATPEQLADPGFKLAADLTLLSAAVVGWSHPDVFGAYSPERALEVVSDGNRSWMTRQLEEVIVERQRFFVP